MISFIGAGMSIVQILDGDLVSLGVIPLLVHMATAVVLLVISAVSAIRTSGIERRMSLGNVGLVIVDGVLGPFLNPLLSVIHLFLALGVLSNFSVMFGIESERGREK